MSSLILVEEAKYSGKFKVGDGVKIIGLTAMEVDVYGGLFSIYFEKEGVITDVRSDMSVRYPYVVEFPFGGSSITEVFNEATLELISAKEDEHNEALNNS